VRRSLIVVLAALCLGSPAAAKRLDQPQGWWLHDIGADQAQPPGPGVPVTVVDSGVDATNPVFSGRPNTTYLNAQTVDGPSEFHGTAVASFVVGVYPQAVLQSWDASPEPRGVSDLAAIAGIETAAAHCPGVINLSLGSTQPEHQIADAVAIAVHNGCLVVAAAGNDALDGNPVTYPAAYAHVLTVGATDERDAPAPFSTFGPWVDLAAPGVAMVGAVPLSHDPSGASTGLAGTSFAAPLVSAAAAWVWTERPALTVGQLAAVLRASARDVGPTGFDLETGSGILDIPAALGAPAPPVDPQEPNDDVDEVVPQQLTPTGQPALTSPARPSIRIAGTLDQEEDPRDLYRIWVPAHRVARVSVAAGGDAAARIWGPKTISVDEGIAARRRDLAGSSITAGKKGFYAYAEVLPTGRTKSASYVLSVRAARR
jgi:subtilisin family serine protease